MLSTVKIQTNSETSILLIDYVNIFLIKIGDLVI